MPAKVLSYLGLFPCVSVLLLVVEMSILPIHHAYLVVETVKHNLNILLELYILNILTWQQEDKKYPYVLLET